MRFRKGATLDTSQVRDVRGGGIGGMGPIGTLGAGGGIVGVILTVILLLVNGGGGGGGLSLGADPSNNFGGATGANSELANECRTGEDANQRRTAASSASSTRCRTTGRAPCGATPKRRRRSSPVR